MPAPGTGCGGAGQSSFLPSYLNSDLQTLLEGSGEADQVGGVDSLVLLDFRSKHNTTMDVTTGTPAYEPG